MSNEITYNPFMDNCVASRSNKNRREKERNEEGNSLIARFHIRNLYLACVK